MSQIKHYPHLICSNFRIHCTNTLLKRLHIENQQHVLRIVCVRDVIAIASGPYKTCDAPISLPPRVRLRAPYTVKDPLIRLTCSNIQVGEITITPKHIYTI